MKAFFIYWTNHGFLFTVGCDFLLTPYFKYLPAKDNG